MDLADDKILKHDNILADGKVFLIIDHKTWKDWLKMTDLTGITCYLFKKWLVLYLLRHSHYCFGRYLRLNFLYKTCFYNKKKSWSRQWPTKSTGGWLLIISYCYKKKFIILHNIVKQECYCDAFFLSFISIIFHNFVVYNEWQRWKENSGNLFKKNYESFQNTIYYVRKSYVTYKEV